MKKYLALSLSLVLVCLIAGVFTVHHVYAQSVPPSRSTDSEPVDRTPTFSRQVRSAMAILPASAQDLAVAMGIQPTDIVSATIGTTDPLGVGIGASSLSYFPTQGSTYAILSSGLASSAETPNMASNLSYQLGGLKNSQGNDLAQLTLRLRVPSDKSCLNVDFAFYSEEFPEYVGSQYNDAFTAELGGTNLSISNNEVVAPLNFAFDTAGNIISVNTVFGVTANTGTTYDGVTPLLTAKQQVPSGQIITLVFSVQDLGDSVYDSTVFLDNFRWSSESNCGFGSEAKPPLILVHGFQGTVNTDLGTSSGYCDGVDTGLDIVRYSAVKNNLTTAAEYWNFMPAWFEAHDYFDNTDELYFDVWIAQLKTGKKQGTPSLADNADCLREQIAYVYSQTNQPITLIGHSMGGLVSRVALWNPQTAKKVKSLYTIGSPHVGIPAIPGWGCSDKQEAVCEMRKYMNIYNELTPNRAGINYTFVGGDHSPLLSFFLSGKHDGLVSSYSSIGWNKSGEYEPPYWPKSSPPVQFWIDEVHSGSFDGPQYNDYRTTNGIDVSQSYRCIKYIMTAKPFSIVPSECRIPSKTAKIVQTKVSDADTIQVTGSLTGQIDVGQTLTRTFEIDSQSKSAFSLSWSGGKLALNLTDPTGQLINESYANTNPDKVVFGYNEGSSNVEASAQYFFTNTLAGPWQISITSDASNIEDIEYFFYAAVESDRILTPAFDKDQYAPGEIAVLTATLTENGGHIAGASLSAIVSLSSGLTDTLTLIDQGAYYSTNYLVPDVPGYMSVDLIAKGSKNGVFFSRSSNLVSVITPNNVNLADAYTYAARDDNGDQLYEALDILVGVNVISELDPDKMNYSLVAHLEADGQLVAQATLDMPLTLGEHTLVIRFDGSEIRSAQQNGPYSVSLIALLNTDLGFNIQSSKNVLMTTDYSWQDFGSCYTLTTGVNPSLGGQVVADPTPNCNGGTQYTVDTEVELTAVPNPNFVFATWMVGESGITNPVSLVISSDKTVVANFLEVTWGEPFTVTTSADPDYIEADGISTSQIAATVVDTDSNIIPGAVVTFTTNLGILSTFTTTANSAGIATVLLTSATTTGTAVVTVTAGTANGNTTVIFVPGPPALVSVVPNLSQIVANGASTSVVTATVKDAFANLVPNQVVTFTTSLGSVTASATTDASGVATGTLTSATMAGTATVTVTADMVNGNATVNFVAGPPASASVTANPSQIVADGVSTSVVAVTVKDAFANLIRNQVVTFTTSLGSVTGSATTDASGVATGTLTSATTTGTATITATAGTVNGNATVTFVAGPPVSVAVTANPSQIVADGVSTSVVTVTVKDAFANLVPNQVVSFTTSLGSVTSSATTDASGVATGTLTSATMVGTVTITATAGTVNGNATVAFVAGPPASVAVTVSPSQIVADGVSTSVVTATVRDVFANLVPNQVVSFTTSLGSVTGSATTDASGVATGTLTSATTAGTATITATAGTVNGNATVIFVAGPPTSVAVTVNPSQIVADEVGTSVVTATVKDAFANLVPNQVVTFTTSLGSVTDSSITDASGVVTGTLTSATTAGTATITATTGTVSGNATVTFVAGPPASVAVAVNPSQIIADGVSTSVVMATVKDTFANLVPNQVVTFTASLGNVTVSAMTDASGVATGTLTSATMAGTAKITATTGTVNGNATATFVAGSVSLLSLAANPISIPADGVSTSVITVTVKDGNSNTIPNVQVNLTTTAGYITSPVTTNANGIATATLTSGQTAATATVTATVGAISKTKAVTFTAVIRLTYLPLVAK